MHEYSLIEGVIKTILDQLEKQGIGPAGSVKEVLLKVGILDVHSEESCRQAYEILTRDTLLEKSRLNLIVVPATLECPQCGYSGSCPSDQANGHDPIPVAECPVCGAVSRVLGGRGVESIELIVDEGHSVS